MDMKTSPIQYCAEQVKRYDYDRYIISLLLPKDQRPLFWALAAFNLEIAKTKEIVTEPTIGLIRLQWWRDSLGRLFDGQCDAHEVLQALSIVKDGHWKFEIFDRLIRAREHDLNSQALSNITAIYDYCIDTNAPLLELQGSSLQQAQIIGGCYGLVGIVRALPFQQDTKYTEVIIHQSIKNICAEVQNRLNLFKAGTDLEHLYHCVIKYYLNRLKKYSFNSSDPEFMILDPLFPFKLWWMK
jgi:hypothetical protein